MRSRSPVLAAAAAALVFSALLIGPPPRASAAEQGDGGATLRQVGDDAQTRQLAFPGTPRDVRVETDADGYVVFGTPNCSGVGLYECRSAIASGSDASHSPVINTRNGYRISWPSSWREGETRHVGYLFSVARDWIAWWYSPNARVDLGQVTRPYAPRALTASVASKDDAARTARVTGTATPGASIRISGSPVATADQSGNWSYRLTGLSVGGNSRTFQQYVDGSYKDQKTVSVTIVDPVQPDQITGDRGSATLERGKTTTVYSTYTPKRAFTTPSGRIEFTAPAGTTFAPGQDSQRGEYRSGSSWYSFGGNSLVHGSRSSDGHTYSFDLGQRNWDVAKDQKFRFGLRVETPVDVGSTSGTMTGRLSGSFTGGTFDTTATTDTTVADQPLTARVDRVDAATRTATIAGTAPGLATRVTLTWDRDGTATSRTVQPSGGTWTCDVDGLTTGVNQVEVEAFAGQASVGRTSVEVPVDAPTFDGSPSFADDVTERATVSGHGVPGAHVVLRDGVTEVGSATVAPDGTWSVRLTAPDRGGVWSLKATQTVAGQPPQVIDVPVDYGQAVRITSPGNGFIISPVFPEVRISGMAAPGAVVRLAEQGVAGSDLGSVTAGTDGRWAVSTPALPIRDQVIEATATGRGANTTRSTVSLSGS
ncbi:MULTISPECIES: hypothetical protein [Curtobacterium]|uniref:Bacterial Ig domain-containing protein n=1 Tax=Curtobacterium oceanosedimentum TaxID=465820 RepID=A0A147DPW6_9MICO|nr:MULTISPECIES: hypothetical protein [Curtobacterium]KTR51550.1 hypothetical protein NS359_09730 [Curtobacterium oceanosedimentum]UBQ03026.1 hypothetical protein LCG91_02330 [Curtobacterium sp. TXMA1]